MARRTLAAPLTVAVLVASTLPVAATAQGANPGDISASTSITAVNTFKTDLDSGGDFHWATGIVSGTITRQFTPQFAAGITLRYDYEDWKFGSARRLRRSGAVEKSQRAEHRRQFELRGRSRPDDRRDADRRMELRIRRQHRRRADLRRDRFGDEGVFARRSCSALGAGIVRQIDETKVFPFLIVHWQIDDKWLLSNPFRAGPAGGAGLELSYALDDNWELAGGGAYRSYRFRLKENGPTPNGVGENRFVPLFARVTRKFGAADPAGFLRRHLRRRPAFDRRRQRQFDCCG